MSKLTHDFGTTFAVFGAGGVGGYFGAALARAGYSVAFIARLEWLVPDALQTGCDTLVSIGNIQSNHTRQVATVAAVLGLKCRLVQETWTKWDDPVYDKVGNILLSRLMGAETLFEGEGYSTEIKETWESALEQVRREGGKPYANPAGASDHPLAGCGKTRW
ncbi:MAG TPA: 2-dehydropantoate 2-reductase N-terminal domain-containing protein [Terriglobales bacterium]|nr:2-dehydropantoate 2-reductase N-terminal domain-containing protein [Terriglobales bacterium]